MLPLSACLIWHPKPSRRQNWLMGAVLVQKLARAILDVKGDYDPEDDLVLQVQARPSDIEGFNLQVRARAWLAQSAHWSSLGLAGLADHQLDVPVGGCGPHTAEWQESLLQAPGRPAECSLFCRMHLLEVGCLPQEFNRQLQDAGADDQLTAMRDIAFELAAPAGELRRQRGSGSHKVRPRCSKRRLCCWSPVQEIGTLCESWPWHDISR